MEEIAPPQERVPQVSEVLPVQVRESVALGRARREPGGVGHDVASLVVLSVAVLRQAAAVRSERDLRDPQVVPGRTAVLEDPQPVRAQRGHQPEQRGPVPHSVDRPPRRSRSFLASTNSCHIHAIDPTRDQPGGPYSSGPDPYASVPRRFVVPK